MFCLGYIAAFVTWKGEGWGGFSLVHMYLYYNMQNSNQSFFMHEVEMNNLNPQQVICPKQLGAICMK